MDEGISQNPKLEIPTPIPDTKPDAKNQIHKPPPPPTSSATIPTASPPGGGGGSSLTFLTAQGSARTITESEIYRYMLKYPQFSTETVMRAIIEARTPSGPVNDPFSY
jgi:hypothetical protein